MTVICIPHAQLRRFGIHDPENFENARIFPISGGGAGLSHMLGPGDPVYPLL